MTLSVYLLRWLREGIFLELLWRPAMVMAATVFEAQEGAVSCQDGAVLAGGERGASAGRQRRILTVGTLTPLRWKAEREALTL